MNCHLCGSKSYINILDENRIRVWTNNNDEPENKKIVYKCIINQCKDCGHAYEPLDVELRDVLRRIYLSENAQASTPMGKGSWGIQRGKDFLDNIDLKNCKSAVEIGCATGYLLRQLKNKGFKELVGIEPSLKKSGEIDGILFLNDFADEKLRLPQKYDLIFSCAVFEHIEEIGKVIDFCRNNLNENGRLFFSVPNAPRQLEDGDPDLFLHQHVQYYTESSITFLLSKHGFESISISTTKDTFYVTAKISNGRDIKRPNNIILYPDYRQKLDRVLEKAETILFGDKVIVHGVNNGLNNILGWLNKDFDFTLVDNDETKQGRVYFNKVVKSMDNAELNSHNAVLIIPLAFYDVIKSAYIDRKFRGKIEDIIPVNSRDFSHEILQ
jgi:SAM-dependent methyltransferase